MISSAGDMARVFSQSENRLQDGEEEILWLSMFVRILDSLVGPVDLPTRSSDVGHLQRDAVLARDRLCGCGSMIHRVRTRKWPLAKGEEVLTSEATTLWSVDRTALYTTNTAFDIPLKPVLRQAESTYIYFNKELYYEAKEPRAM